MTTPAPSITCPRCKATSYHPRDISDGYCGRCHWWTSDPILGPVPPPPPRTPQTAAGKAALLRLLERRKANRDRHRDQLRRGLELVRAAMGGH